MGNWWAAAGRNALGFLFRALFVGWLRSLGLLMLLHLALKFLARIPLCQAQLQRAMPHRSATAERAKPRGQSIEDVKEHHPLGPQRCGARVLKVIRPQTQAIFTVLVEVAVNVLFKIGFMLQSLVLLVTAGRGEASYNAYLRSSSFLLRSENRPPEEDIVSSRHIVFIRHGESYWNMVVNRRPLWGVGLRVAGVALLEAFLGCEADSAIIDSPLSWKGRQQASDLGIFWEAFLSRYYATAGAVTVDSEKQGNTKTPRMLGSSAVELVRLGSGAIGGLPRGGLLRSGTPSPSAAIGGTDRALSMALEFIASGNFAVASSGLRRAVSTSLIALQPLLTHWETERNLYSESTDESLEPVRDFHHTKIYALQSLQEVTRNADGVSMTNFQDGLRFLTQSYESMFKGTAEDSDYPHAPCLKVPFFERHGFGTLDLESHYRNRVDFSDLVTTLASKSHAERLPRRAYLFARKLFTPPQLFERMKSFASWACSPDLSAVGGPSKPVQAVIVVGHSIWLRKFLTLFLPPLSTHAFKHQKLPNCSMLHFELIEYRVKSAYQQNRGVDAPSHVDYWIDPSTIHVLS